jgi:Cu-processing system ATP-binding protein
MSIPRIDLRAVRHNYGSVHALSGIDLEVGPGEMLGLIGHNGAGKSTLFKLMLGLISPSGGQVLIDGVSTSVAAFRAARYRIGYLPEAFATYDNLTGAEVLRLFADLRRVPRAACAEALAQVGLQAAARRPVRGYSKGMRQRLGFAQVLLGSPDLVFLDEPTNGLDPEAIHDFYRVLRELRARGATIVIASHILAELEERVDRLLVLRAGRIAASGTLAQLRARSPQGARVEVATRADATEDVAALLAPAASGAVGRSGTVLRLACGPDRKMDVLARLATLGDAVLDVTVRDAPLEELFLGIGGSDAVH